MISFFMYGISEECVYVCVEEVEMYRYSIPKSYRIIESFRYLNHFVL